MHGAGVKPMNIKFFNSGESLGRDAFVENALHAAVADGVEDKPMLVAQDLLFLLVGEAGLGGFVGIGNGALANAASANEDLRLQQQLVLPSFALDVVNR